MGVVCCCDNADTRNEKLGKTISLGYVSLKGQENVDDYIHRFPSLDAEKCVQGMAGNDDELGEVVQEYIQMQDTQCLMIISPQSLKGYKSVQNVASSTGLLMLSQLILASAKTLKIFHLNDQSLIVNNSAQIIAYALRECQNMMIVNLSNCILGNTGAMLIFNSVKNIRPLKEINLSLNGINAQTRDKIQSELKYYPYLKVIF